MEYKGFFFPMNGNSCEPCNMTPLVSDHAAEYPQITGHSCATPVIFAPMQRDQPSGNTSVITQI